MQKKNQFNQNMEYKIKLKVVLMRNGCKKELAVEIFSAEWFKNDTLFVQKIKIFMFRPYFYPINVTKWCDSSCVRNCAKYCIEILRHVGAYIHIWRHYSINIINCQNGHSKKYKIIFYYYFLEYEEKLSCDISTFFY